MPKILLLAALMLQTVPATVAAEQGLPSVRVSYADLDLSTEAGRLVLDRRMRRAVESLCPSDNGIRDLVLLSAIRTCRTKLMAQVAAPRDRALAAAKNRTVAAARR